MRPELQYVHDRHAWYGISRCMSTVPCEAWTLHELSHWSVLFEGQRPANVGNRVTEAINLSPNRPDRDLQEALAIAVELSVSDSADVTRDLHSMYEEPPESLLNAFQLQECVEAAMKTEDTRRRAAWLVDWITQEASLRPADQRSAKRAW